MKFLFVLGYERHDNYVDSHVVEAESMDEAFATEEVYWGWGDLYGYELAGPVYEYVQKNVEPTHQPFAGLADLMAAA